ncbi:MAG TPA: DUF2147 domain-containing protein [Aestuariivirga sp.]|nr:DUF2147 domain-containing protein [Aestuariivirga sp.]
MTFKSLFSAASLILLAGAPMAFASGAPGTWAMKNGKVIVRVTDCGSGLCGRIVALKEPISKIDGKPKIDRENPDPSLRTRPLIGLSILVGMKAAGEGQWKGAIYNPDDGKTYTGSVKLEGGTMKVQGCVLKMFCKTNTFVRVN